jgi:hypothetical protein
MRNFGGKVKEWHFPHDASSTCWALSLQYIKESIRNIELHLIQFNRSLQKSDQPVPSAYKP